METMLIVILGLVVLAITSIRWGVDSSDGINSLEWVRRQNWRGFTRPLLKEERMSQQAPKDRMVGTLLLSSIIAGLIAGISARLVMRVVALTAHMPLQFTAASLNIVLIGLILRLFLLRSPKSCPKVCSLKTDHQYSVEAEQGYAIGERLTYYISK
jgi:hypothetical protein